MSGGHSFDQTTQALMNLQEQIDALSEQLRSFRLMFWRHLQEHHKESMVPNAPEEIQFRKPICPLPISNELWGDVVIKRNILEDEFKPKEDEDDSITRTWEIEES